MVTPTVDVFVSPIDLQEKNNFCFLYKITICKVAPLCEISLSCELLQMLYSTYRLKEIYINMLKPNKTQTSTISKPPLIKSSTPRLDLFSVVPVSKPLLYQNPTSSQAVHLGLICSV